VQSPCSSTPVLTGRASRAARPPVPTVTNIGLAAPGVGALVPLDERLGNQSEAGELIETDLHRPYLDGASTSVRVFDAQRPHGWPCLVRPQGGGLEMDVLVDRRAGLDVHEDTVVAMVRRPSATGVGREQGVRQYRTFTGRAAGAAGLAVAERVGGAPRPGRDVRSSGGRRHLLL
jgi:hypothetical protein